MSSGEGKGSIRVLAFAGARDAVGASELVVDLPERATASAVFAQIVRAHPGLAPYEPIVRIAVNGTYALPGDMVSPGDEVALIPPVAGG